MNDVEKQVKAAMQAALDHFKAELKSLRTGRANSAMLDKVTVEVYGSHLRLKELANITVPEARQILVTPFDFNNVHAIKKGIEAANLGVNPMVDGKLIQRDGDFGNPLATFATGGDKPGGVPGAIAPAIVAGPAAMIHSQVIIRGEIAIDV